MTLVLTVNGPETIWLLADRRLTWPGRSPKDDARKLMFLETTDGVAILGYCGLGETCLRTEPADWMSTVLRGRNLPLERSLGLLADAMKKQLPRHLVQLPGPSGPMHNVIVPSFIGDEARLYSIDLAFRADRKKYKFRYTRHMVSSGSQASVRTPRLALGGSGSWHLMRNRNWMRPLLHMVRASDRLKVHPREVADHLAGINNEVHLNTTDGSVGPRCIVAWRHRKGGVHKGGGAQQFYTGINPDHETVSAQGFTILSGEILPAIVRGADLRAQIQALLPHAMGDLKALLAGVKPQQMDKEAINRDLAHLPDKPDEELR